MNSLRASFAPYWESIQRTLFPRLEQVVFFCVPPMVQPWLKFRCVAIYSMVT